MKIDASPSAIEHIAERGGRLFVWRDASGLLHADTTPPDAPITFTSVPADSFELLQDERIPEPLLWRIVREGVRPRRVRAHWNSRVPAGTPGSGNRFWRELFRR